MKTVLFVCTGNTCRSPMAEAIFNDMLDEYPRLRELGYEAASAGTYAMEGAPINEMAEEALEHLGIEMDHKHKARGFSEEIGEEADLILGVSEMIVEEILALAPAVEDNAHILKAYAQGIDGLVGSDQYDIEDPYREPLQVYIECAKEIQKNIELIMKRLEKENQA